MSPMGHCINATAGTVFQFGLNAIQYFNAVLNINYFFRTPSAVCLLYLLFFNLRKKRPVLKFGPFNLISKDENGERLRDKNCRNITINKLLALDNLNS